MYSLHILSGPWKGKRLTIRDPALLIGRDPECTLQLPDDEISRRHAVIEDRPDGVTIRDLGSLNGFILNRKPSREARLQDGAILELGRTQLQFHGAGPAVSRRRRLSWLQGFTGLLVAVVLILQMVFLIALSLGGKNLLVVIERAFKNTSVPVTTESAPSPAEPAPTAEPVPVVVAETPPEPVVEPAQPAPEPVEETAPSAVTDELAQIRAEVDDLRRQMAETVPVPSEPGPPAAVEDPLVARAQKLLDEALLELQRNNLLQADNILERIQIMAPDFLPAYVERARLYEQRGQLLKAGEQWADVLRRSIGTPLYEQAAAERIRVARAEMQRPTPPTPAQRREAAGIAPPAGGAARLPRRIRIASIEQEKLPETERYEEMRLVRIGLRPVASERTLDADELHVAVYFFDEDRNTKDIVLTQTSKQPQMVRVEGEGLSGAARSVTATYVVPVGARAVEEEKTARRFRYFGYAVRVYYREDLQDEAARPRDLLDKVKTLPSPFHAPPATPPKINPAPSNAAPASPAPARPAPMPATPAPPASPGA